MPEIITIQVGQCGNQVGSRFWQSAISEYEAIKNRYPDLISTQGIDTIFDKSEKKKKLRPRTVMVDMEEGVIRKINRDLFGNDDPKNYHEITDCYGSGNNWAYGYYYYGLKHYCKIEEIIRKTAEPCNNLDSFFLINSLGGGTGSGVGTFILREILRDDYPTVQRICFPIISFGSNDDVITSPYNTLFSLAKLNMDSDCVIPFENEAISTILCNSNKNSPAKEARMSFSGINDYISQFLLNFTCYTRFHGSMNIDLGEFVTNLIPYPRMNILVSAQSPVFNSSKMKANPSLRENLRKSFIMKNQSISNVDIRQNDQISTAVCIRGRELPISELTSSIETMKSLVKCPYWNKDAWKIGHCHAPAVNSKENGELVFHDNQVLCLSNTTGIINPLRQVKRRFDLLYRKKAHLHHYLDVDGFDDTVINESLEILASTVKDYQSIQKMADEDVNEDFYQIYSKFSSKILN